MSLMLNYLVLTLISVENVEFEIFKLKMKSDYKKYGL